MIRKAAVSGQFYPGTRDRLQQAVNALLGEASSPQAAFGAMVPHAGYVYSGAVAAAVYRRLVIPELVILLGPNHTGLGPPFALMPESSWETPLGAVPVSPLVRKLQARISLLQFDETAHRHEHSLEVQLPFLQACASGPLEIMPVIIGSLDREQLLRLGRELAAFIRDEGRETIILASSDMSHFEPDRLAREKDRYALEAVLDRDPAELLARVTRQKISMCGVGPTAALLAAAKQAGAGQAELAAYATSGDISGDTASVVGYAGVIFS